MSEPNNYVYNMAFPETQKRNWSLAPENTYTITVVLQNEMIPSLAKMEQNGEL